MQTCSRCGLAHADDYRACPMVKAIEIDQLGHVTRVEFMTAMDFPPQKKEEPEIPYAKLPSVL